MLLYLLRVCVPVVALSLYKRCELPRTLKETGKVLENQLESIAKLALDDGSIMFNPREVSHEDAMAVLRRAWA